MKIKIYQINPDRAFKLFTTEDIDAYVSVDENHPICSELYDCVFDGEIAAEKLEDLFRVFDGSHPMECRVPRVEFTDVIEIAESGTIKKGFYFCDELEFKGVEFDPEVTQMREDKIKVVIVEPGKYAREADISCSLEDLQKTVGGYIEAYYPFEEEVCIVCNDEGKINGMKLNRAVYGSNNEIMDIIAGPFFVCDCSGENFGSLNEEQVKKYTELFRCPEHFFMINGDVKAMKYEPMRNDMER